MASVRGLLNIQSLNELTYENRGFVGSAGPARLYACGRSFGSGRGYGAPGGCRYRFTQNRTCVSVCMFARVDGVPATRDAPAAYSHPRSRERTPTCVVTHPVWCVDPHAARCVHAFHAPHCRVFASMCASAASGACACACDAYIRTHLRVCTRRCSPEPTERHAL